MTPIEKVVEKRVWDVDDEYLVIPEIQVYCDEFKAGDRVRVIIEKIEE
jgi:hypothetical protein